MHPYILAFILAMAYHFATLKKDEPIYRAPSVTTEDHFISPGSKPHS